MGPIAKKVWTMWPSLDEMAEDLGESVNALRRSKDKGELPHPRHDRILILKDRSHGGRLTKSRLDAVRAVRYEVDLAMRGDMIRAFYKACGGVAEVSRRTGTGTPHLHTNATRGWLNKTAKAAYCALAQEVGFDLPDDIFTRPLG